MEFIDIATYTYTHIYIYIYSVVSHIIMEGCPLRETSFLRKAQQSILEGKEARHHENDGIDTFYSDCTYPCHPWRVAIHPRDTDASGLWSTMRSR